APGAQRLPADHRPDAANREKVHRRHRSAAPEEQRHHPEALAAGIHRVRPELKPERVGRRTEEEPVMITSHPDALADLGFVRVLVVYFTNCRHGPAASGNTSTVSGRRGKTTFRPPASARPRLP